MKPALSIAVRVARTESRGLCWSSLAGFAELTKPGITFLVVCTTAVAFYIGSPTFRPVIGIAAVFGTLLLASGASALNQYLERDLDALMLRTRNRPLPVGRISPFAALIFGVMLSAGGAAVLFAFVNIPVVFLGIFSVTAYLFIYTPLKTRTPLCTLVGAVPGAIPALIGWTAARGHLELPGVTLFMIVFLWQMPHFFAIGWNFADDYARAGFLVPTRGHNVGRQIVFYCLALLFVSTLPAVVGFAGKSYLACALILGTLYLKSGWVLMKSDSKPDARRLFNVSLLYLPLLLLALVIGHM